MNKFQFIDIYNNVISFCYYLTTTLLYYTLNVWKLYYASIFCLVLSKWNKERFKKCITVSHRHSKSVHGFNMVNFLHWHVCIDFFGHGSHSPGWQLFSQLCKWHVNILLHVLVHDQLRTLHRTGFGSFCLQLHSMLIILGQGGQDPGNE